MNDTPRLSDSAYLKKKGWKSMKDFMLAYKLKLPVEKDYEKGKSILAAMRGADEESEAAAKRAQSPGTQNTSQQTQTSGAARGGNNPSADTGNIKDNIFSDKEKAIVFTGTAQVYPSQGSGGSAKD